MWIKTFFIHILGFSSTDVQVDDNEPRLGMQISSAGKNISGSCDRLPVQGETAGRADLQSMSELGPRTYI